MRHEPKSWHPEKTRVSLLRGPLNGRAFTHRQRSPRCSAVCPPHLPEAGAWASSFAVSTPHSGPEARSDTRGPQRDPLRRRQCRAASPGPTAAYDPPPEATFPPPLSRRPRHRLDVRLSCHRARVPRQHPAADRDGLPGLPLGWIEPFRRDLPDASRTREPRRPGAGAGKGRADTCAEGRRAFRIQLLRPPLSGSVAVSHVRTA